MTCQKEENLGLIRGLQCQETGGGKSFVYLHSARRSTVKLTRIAIVGSLETHWGFAPRRGPSCTRMTNQV